MYRIIQREAGSISTRHATHGDQVWTKGQITYKRKRTKCAMCGLEIGARHTQGYRPLTNKTNRTDRICVTCAEQTRVRPLPKKDAGPKRIDYSDFNFEARVLNSDGRWRLEHRISKVLLTYGKWQTGMIDRVDLELYDQFNLIDRASIGIGVNQDFSPVIEWIKQATKGNLS